MKKNYSRITSITNTGSNSDKYGKCDCCHKYCETVFLKSFYQEGFHKGELFGHRKCLEDVKTQHV